MRQDSAIGTVTVRLLSETALLSYATPTFHNSCWVAPKPQSLSLYLNWPSLRSVRPKGELVEVRCAPGHHALVVDTNIGPANIVTHDDHNVGRRFIGGLCHDG